MQVTKTLACTVFSLLAQAAIACSPPPPKVGPDGRLIVDPYKYNYSAVVVGLRDVVLPFGRERTPKTMQALDLEVVATSNLEVAIGSRQLVVYPGIGGDCSSEPRSYNVSRSWEYFPVGAKVTVRGNRLDAAFVENAP